MIRLQTKLSESPLPVNVDLIYKLLAFNVLGNSYLYIDEFKLPFLSWMQDFIALPHLSVVLTSIVMLGVALILITNQPKLGTLLIFASMLVIVLGCMPCYADSRFYLFSMLLLMTLYDKKSGLLFIKLQVIILYLGSGLNKLFDPDWQSGQYIHNWLGHQLSFDGYIKAAALLPDMVLAKIISWSVITCELFMAFCFSRKSFNMIGITLGLIFHTGSILAANSVFGSFVAGAFISYLAFIDWPKKITLVLSTDKKIRKLARIIKWVDPYRIMQLEQNGSARTPIVIINEQRHKGLKAVRQMLLYTPMFYLLVILFVLAPGFGYDWLKAAMLYPVILFFVLVRPGKG